MKLNKLPLNVIGLNRVGLNQIGSPSHRADTSARPYIDPEVLASLVAVCICDGKSNDDPDRAVIKNLVDPDNPFVISNAAYKLNSGYGKYEEDFTTWRKYQNVVVTKDKITVTDKFNQDWLIYKYSKSSNGISPMRIKITGIPINARIEYRYAKTSSDTTLSSFDILEDGIYDIPESFIINNEYSVGFKLSAGDWTHIEITQIPSHQGALVTDGKDDMITSTKTVQEMLGGSNEVTVVSMVHQIGLSSLTTINNIRSESVAHVVCRNICSSAGKTGVYGYSRQINTNNPPTLINNILGDKKDYTAEGNSALDPTDKFFVQGYKYSGTISEVSQIAYYWTIIANKVLTTDQINQVISYFNLDKHVKPDIIYDTIRQGITNENHASFNDELVDFSGNGHNMKIYNSAWNKESGINGEGAWQTDGVSDYGKVENLPIYKDYTVVADREIVDGLIDNANGGVATRSYNYAKGAFGFDWKNQAFSFGGNTDRIIDVQRFISYQSKYVNNGIQLITGNVVDNNPLYMARLGEENRYSKLALWSFLLFSYTLSEFLLERQLKRYKLGTLYPGMIEWRPKVNINVPVVTPPTFSMNNGSDIITNGQYIPEGTEITIRIFTTTDSSVGGLNEATAKINGVDIELSPSGNKTYYGGKFIVSSKQKIDITIDEYIRYEDIVQPYPAIINLKQDGKTITWGDKLKVGSDIVFAGSANLLPELYTVSETRYNGVTLYPNTIIKVEKSMVFDNARIYLKANEPNCILSPNRLRIPNSSYKILGYIPDLTGKGNHGRLNNFAYAGMSGANGYVEDFTKWSKNSSLDDVEITYDRIKVNKLTRSTVLYVTSNKFINKIKIVASGIPNGGKLTFTQYPDNAIENNKEFEIGGVTTTGSWGFSIKEGLNLDWSNLVIQQIGEHEGSICFDGTDDHITISNVIGGKCIMAKVTVNRNSGIIYDQRRANVPNKSWMQLNPSSVIFEQNAVSTYIDGISNHNVTGSDLVSKTVNLTCELEIGDTSGTYQPTIGSSYAVGYTTNINLYEFMLFPDVPNEEEIKELNDIVGIENNIEVS